MRFYQPGSGLSQALPPVSHKRWRSMLSPASPSLIHPFFNNSEPVKRTLTEKKVLQCCCLQNSLENPHSHSSVWPQEWIHCLDPAHFFCLSSERLGRCRAAEKMPHHIWVAFNPATIPHKYSSASDSSSGEQGRAHSWCLWESFALQKIGLAMQGPELGTHEAHGRENPSASSAALKRMKQFRRTIGWCQSRSGEVGVSGAKEGEKQSLVPQCHSPATVWPIIWAGHWGERGDFTVRNFFTW